MTDIERIEQLRAALKPFADMVERIPYAGHPLSADYRAVRLRDCEAARRVLEQEP